MTLFSHWLFALKNWRFLTNACKGLMHPWYLLTTCKETSIALYCIAHLVLKSARKGMHEISLIENFLHLLIISEVSLPILYYFILYIYVCIYIYIIYMYRYYLDKYIHIIYVHLYVYTHSTHIYVYYVYIYIYICIYIYVCVCVCICVSVFYAGKIW